MTSDLKTTLYLIRHGEPAEAYQDRFYGQMDVPLSERGLEQSRRVAERLASVPFDAVYASDLERAGRLATMLAAPRDLPVRRLTVFRERSIGVIQGCTVEEFRERHPEAYRQWRAHRVFHRVDGGETWEDLYRRIVPAVEELVAAFPAQRIALVGHAGPIRVTLAHCLGMPLSRIFQILLDYGSVNVIEFPQGEAPRVRLING